MRAQASRVDRSGMPMSPRGVIERRQIVVERRVAPSGLAGGAVVLRGSRSPATPNVNPPGPNLNGAGYGASRPVGPVLLPSAGWDRELDFSGLDYGGAPFTITRPRAARPPPPQTQLCRVVGLEAPRIERREIDPPRCAVEDQLGHRFAGRRCVENAPNAVAGSDVSTRDAGHAADQRQPVARDRTKAGLARDDIGRGERRRDG